jgi:serine palmitoyltransferase
MSIRARSPFGTSPPRSSSNLDASPPSDSANPARRSSFSKAKNNISQLFSSNKQQRSPDGSNVGGTRGLYLQSTPSSSSLSLPTISLSTAVGEKSKMENKSTTTLFQPPTPEEAARIAKAHANFGPLGSKEHLYRSEWRGGDFPNPIEDEPPYYYLLTTYISYLILIIFGHVRDFFGKRFRKDKYSYLSEKDGYAPLNSDFDNFYVRRLKMRINDLFARPITGCPGRFITLLDRKSDDFNLTFRLTGTTTETLNMSSYNYLGFAQSEGLCADMVEECVRKNGLSYVSNRADTGTSDLTVETEAFIAKFVGKEDSILFSMGYVTNATAFPALVGKGSLLISDELNHASIRYGMRLSGAVIGMFKHNDVRDLERVLREAISQGQPRTHRPWKNILVAVEGLYSMEGTMVNLPAIIELKKKYKFNLFVDEAHSIGALGPNGRGVCDYFGIDTSEVDILMGTLTKSFGANGGYIAGSKELINKLRVTNAGMLFAEAPAPPVLMQIQSSLRIIAGELNPGQGEERLQRLAFNSRYLRLGLKRLGLIVYGHDDSPIIPVLLYHPAKMPAFSRQMLLRKISVVAVGYPATPLVSSRARFCVSAAHTKDDLDRLLRACDEIGDLCQIKFSSGIAGGNSADTVLETDAQGNVLPPAVKPRWNIEDVIRTGVEDVKHPLR